MKSGKSNSAAAMDKLSTQITQFFSSPSFAVVGASDDPRKYGHKVFRCYLAHDKRAFPVNPNADMVLGHRAYKNLQSLPEHVESVSIITPPAVTDKIVDDAIANGVKNIWMQPGAEHPSAVKRAEERGLNVIHGGPCLLVVLGYRE
ncbi:MAG TPA: CoA-binding protein [Candidatus Obscuribacterales bacterium]